MATQYARAPPCAVCMQNSAVSVVSSAVHGLSVLVCGSTGCTGPLVHGQGVDFSLVETQPVDGTRLLARVEQFAADSSSGALALIEADIANLRKQCVALEQLYTLPAAIVSFAQHADRMARGILVPLSNYSADPNDPWSSFYSVQAVIGLLSPEFVDLCAQLDSLEPETTPHADEQLAVLLPARNDAALRLQPVLERYARELLAHKQLIVDSYPLKTDWPSNAGSHHYESAIITLSLPTSKPALFTQQAAPLHDAYMLLDILEPGSTNSTVRVVANYDSQLLTWGIFRRAIRRYTEWLFPDYVGWQLLTHRLRLPDASDQAPFAQFLNLYEPALVNDEYVSEMAVEAPRLLLFLSPSDRAGVTLIVHTPKPVQVRLPIGSLTAALRAALDLPERDVLSIDGDEAPWMVMDLDSAGRVSYCSVQRNYAEQEEGNYDQQAELDQYERAQAKRKARKQHIEQLIARAGKFY